MKAKSDKQKLEEKIKQQAHKINELNKKLNDQRQKVKDSLNRTHVGRKLASIESILNTDKSDDVKVVLIEGYLRD